MNDRTFADRVLRRHYGVEEDGEFRNKWICPECPGTELSLRKEKTRGHGVVEYAWTCPNDPSHNVEELMFDTKTMHVVQSS